MKGAQCLCEELPGAGIGVQSGVGCAWAIIGAALRGKDMDTECSCGGDSGSCCGQSEEPGCECGGK